MIQRANIDPHQAAEAMQVHRDRLTERARQGDFDAFAALHQSLSRDPVDLGIEWERFQQEKQ